MGIWKSLFVIVTTLILMSGMFTSVSNSMNVSKDLKINQQWAGSILHVSTAGSTYTKIQDAVDNSTAGDTIVIGNGTYVEGFTVMTSNLTMKGNSTKKVVIEIEMNYGTAINIQGKNCRIMNIGFRSKGNNNTLMDLNSANTVIENCSFNGSLDRSVLINMGQNAINTKITRSEFFLRGNFSTAIQDRNGSSGLFISKCSLYISGFDSYLIYMENGNNCSIKDSMFETMYPAYSIEKEFRRLVHGTHYMGCIVFIHTDALNINSCEFSLYGMNYPSGGGHLTPVGIQTVIDPHTSPSIFYHSHNITINNNKCSAIWSGLPVFVSIEGVDTLIFRYNLNSTNSNSYEMVSVINSKNIEVSKNTMDRLIFQYVQDATFNENTCLGLSVSGLPYDMAKAETNVVVANNNLDNLWYPDSHWITPLSLGGSGLSVHDNLIRTRGTGIYLGPSYNSEIFNNDIYFQSFGNIRQPEEAGILVRGVTRDKEGNPIPSNLSIHHNLIRGHGEPSSDFGTIAPIPAVGIIEYDVYGGNISNNRIEMWGNGTYDLDNRILGIWLLEVNDVQVDHNDISVIVDAGIPLLVGEGRMGKVMVDQKVQHCEIIGNKLLVEGNRGTGLFLSNITENNTFVRNDISLKNGSDMTFVRADNLANATIEFGKYERVNSVGRELILFRGHFLVPGFGPDIGPNITTIGLPVKTAQVAPRCKLTVLQRLSLTAVDHENNTQYGVDFSIDNNGIYHNTSGYGGTELVDRGGVFGPYLVRDKFFDGSSVPTDHYTQIKAKYMMAQLWEETITKQIREDTLEVFEIPFFYPPEMPFNLTAENIPDSQDIRLSWDPVLEHCTNYVLENRMIDTWERVKSIDHPVTVFEHTGLTQDTMMTYRLSASNGGILSDFTQPVEIMTGDITPPLQPEGLKILEVNMGSVQVEWDPAVERDVVGTKATIRKLNEMDPEKVVELGIGHNSTSFNGLESDTEYEVAVSFMDDADLFSNRSLINVKTEFPMGTISVNVEYEEGSPWAGNAPNIIVKLEGENFTQPSSVTDQYGKSIIGNIRVPDTLKVSIIPKEGTEGIIGDRSGYLRIVVEQVILLEHGSEEVLDIVLKYYDKDHHLDLGKISGKVSYPNFGSHRGDAVKANVSIMGPDGTVYSASRTDAHGYFEISDLPLPFLGYVKADPPPDSGERYDSVTSELITLSEEDWEYVLGLVLIYIDPGDVEIPTVSIKEYGPVGMDVNISSSIFIKFSHPVTGPMTSDLFTVDKKIEGFRISISDNGKTLTIYHDGLEDDTIYNASVSFMLEFEGALGMNESFSWSFRTDQKVVGDTADPVDEKSNLIFFLVILFSIIVTIGISLLLAWSRKRIITDAIDEDLQSMDHDQIPLDPLEEIDEG